MTKVGVYALLRLFPLIFPDDLLLFQPLILVAAGLTMVTGVLGALAQHNVRRLLAFDLVSQGGYLLMGFGVGTRTAIAATAIYILHLAFTKSALFLICGVAERDFGTSDMRRMGGLSRTRPGLALLFGLAALSLAGIPPLSGFLAKLALVQATFAAGAYGVGLVSLGVGLLTMVPMVRLWNELFWKVEPHDRRLAHGDGQDDEHEHDQTARPLHPPDVPLPPLRPLVLLPLVALLACVVSLGLLGGPMLDAANQASLQATDRAAYIQLVLGSPSTGATP